jgi:hypothetical protein
MAKWLVIVGVAIESVCTVSLFAFDEGVSSAQQSKIIALESALQPRRIFMQDHNGDKETRAVRFAAVKKYAGASALIQPIPTFEAQTLASDIITALTTYSGWTAEITNGVPTGLIREGVRILTVEEFTAKRPVKWSTAGQAGHALCELLVLDLGPPYGPLFSVNHEPFSKELFQSHLGGFVIPPNTVLILVGEKPMGSAFIGPPFQNINPAVATHTCM